MARTVAAIQADLDAFYLARTRALTPGYSVDSGQGRQSVQPLDLTAIQKTILALEAEMEAATTGGSGMIYAGMNR